MEKPASPRSWRDLLAALIAQPQEKQRAAEALQVNPYTLTRWASGASTPRPENLKKLPAVFPRYQEAFHQLIQTHLQPDIALPTPIAASPDIPSWYLLQILRAWTTARNPYSIWGMQKQALEQLLNHLSREEPVGLDLSIVRCIPEEPKVSGLCETIGIGTPPWSPQLTRRLLFLGAESLAGWVVEQGEPGVIQDMQERGRLPFRSGRYERSAAAYPVQREGRLAGCLLAVSNVPGIWTESRLSYLEAYSWVLALSFQDQEFFPLSCISLCEFPVQEDQQVQALLPLFVQRVRALRREHPDLSLHEAEARLLQRMAAEVLAVSHPIK